MDRKTRILIVDDDAELSRMIGLVLHRGGYEVFSAQSGAEGLAKMDEVRPDLMIVDIMMPLVDGYEVCRRIRAKPATRNLPIIVLSALDKVDDKVKGFQAGADDYVAKPVDNRELVARVQALLQRASLGRPSPARTVTFVGAKGGVGATTAAINVAVILAKQGKSTILGELRPHGGTVRYQLKLKSEQHLGGLLALEPSQIRRPEVDRRLVRHTSGLRLLLAPPEDADTPLTPGHVEALLEVLTQRADFLVLDVGAAMVTPGLRRALELSEQILLVTEPEILSVACARRQLEKLRAWDVYGRADLVVMTRTPATTDLNRVQIENQLGMGAGEAQAASRWEPRALEVDVRLRQGVAGVIPSAPELFHESVREGVPITLIEPSAAASRALLDLTEWLSEKYTPVKPAPGASRSSPTGSVR